MTQLFDARKVADTGHKAANKEVFDALNAGMRFAIVFYDSINGPVEGMSIVAFSGLSRAMVVLANGAVIPFNVFCDACEHHFEPENYFSASLVGILNEFNLTVFNTWMYNIFGKQYRGVVAGQSSDKITARYQAKFMASGNLYFLSAFGKTLRVDDRNIDCLQAWLYKTHDAREVTFWALLQNNPQSVCHLAWNAAREVELEMCGLMQDEHFPTPAMDHCFLQMDAFDAIKGVDGAGNGNMMHIVQLLAQLSIK